MADSIFEAHSAVLFVSAVRCWATPVLSKATDRKSHRAVVKYQSIVCLDSIHALYMRLVGWKVIGTILVTIHLANSQ